MRKATGCGDIMGDKQTAVWGELLIKRCWRYWIIFLTNVKKALHSLWIGLALSFAVQIEDSWSAVFKQCGWSEVALVSRLIDYCVNQWMNSNQLNLPPHSHTVTAIDKQRTHIHTQTQKCASAAASKNKFECCHDVIDVVNIWRISCVKTSAYAGSRHPTDAPSNARGWNSP